MIVDPAKAPIGGTNGLMTLHLSVAGGLTQFGAYLDTLEPGAWSGKRHWHSAEDEFVLILAGTATLRDDAGMTDLLPGDAVCWRHGDQNLHHLTNRGDVRCRWLIVGARAAGDVCTYPDDGSRQINGETAWQVVAADGTVLREGDLPGELLGLRAAWGQRFDGSEMPNVIRAGAVAPTSTPGSSLSAELGDYSERRLSDAGGLTQFGAFTETLMPGSRSSHRHWHAEEDEFLYVLEGVVTLHENDGPQEIGPGTCVCWPAGVLNAHCVENRTSQPVTYFIAGSRLPEDEVTYPDTDLHYSRRNGQVLVTRKDGSDYRVQR